MPCYYFDVHDQDIMPDYEGAELSNLDVARVRAVRLAADYLEDNPAVNWDGREIRTVVRNEDGRAVFAIVTQACQLT